MLSGLLTVDRAYLAVNGSSRHGKKARVAGNKITAEGLRDKELAGKWQARSFAAEGDVSAPRSRLTRRPRFRIPDRNRPADRPFNQSSSCRIELVYTRQQVRVQLRVSSHHAATTALQVRESSRCWRS
jgi:hypothetical protein